MHKPTACTHATYTETCAHASAHGHIHRNIDEDADAEMDVDMELVMDMDAGADTDAAADTPRPKSGNEGESKAAHRRLLRSVRVRPPPLSRSVGPSLARSRYKMALLMLEQISPQWVDELRIR